MRKVKQLVVISLIVLFLAGVGHARGPYGMPFDDAEVYIQALEDAMDARYGSRDAWPRGFDTFLAVAKYYSGVDTSYESTLAWTTAELQAMEGNAISDDPGPRAVGDFLDELSKAMDSRDRHGFSWPFEARALISAAYTYPGDASTAWYDILPSENDLLEEEAIAIAKEAIQKEYNLSDLGINQYEIYTTFFRDGGEGTPYWRVVIGLNDQGTELYYAYIASPSGEVLRATRNEGNG